MISAFKDNLDLTGRVSVITGGASGIGEAITKTFAEHGSAVAVLDLNKKAGSKLISCIKKSFKISCAFYSCDVSNFEQVSTTCKDILNKFGRVDNLVCSAGYLNVMPIDKITLNVWEKSIGVNINGVFYFINCLINSMISQGKGNIIIIGSSATVNGSVSIDYTASKCALHGIIKSLSYELLSKGIRANIITPAVIDTPMLRVRYPNNEETNKMLNAQIPFGRIGKPQDIANVALFLASDMSEYICGHEIIADGGRIFYSHPAKGKK